MLDQAGANIKFMQSTVELAVMCPAYRRRLQGADSPLHMPRPGFTSETFFLFLVGSTIRAAYLHNAWGILIHDTYLTYIVWHMNLQRIYIPYCRGSFPCRRRTLCLWCYLLPAICIDQRQLRIVHLSDSCLEITQLVSFRGDAAGIIEN
jgi:hypothetical protein